MERKSHIAAWLEALTAESPEQKAAIEAVHEETDRTLAELKARMAMMEDRTKHDAASELDYIQAQAELEAHMHDPLAAPLCVHVQPLTITRLDRFCAATGQSRDEAVNAILHQWLYMEGE